MKSEEPHSFEEALKKVHELRGEPTQNLIEEISRYFPLTDYLNSEILMHRDAHFSGSFPEMIEYYQNEGKGCVPDFDIERMEMLYKIEQGLNQNLAPILLTGPDAEKVGKAKELYRKLRDLYEVKNPKKPYPILIADLILSEEESPEKEISAIVKEKKAIVPLLLDLLKSEDFYDPLNPGYGQAPLLAARCIGMIGEKSAVYTLFEALDQGDFGHEEIILKALKTIGAPAKEFLLKVLKSRPIKEDNVKAAFALIPFKDEEEVSKLSLKMLIEPEVLKEPILSTYLILVCEGLKEKKDQEDFLNLLKNPQFPKSLRKDIESISKTFNPGFNS